MKASNSVNSWFGRFGVISLGLSAVLVLGGFGGGGGKPPPATTGSLSVSIGFGAGGSYQCTGSGTVSIRLSTGATQARQYGFSGTASSTAPGCNVGVSFGNLPAGPLTITDSSGASCPKSITAGQFTTATIRIENRSCV